MRDPSPYAGQTVRLRPGGDYGGLDAAVVDWYERTGTGQSWRNTVDGVLADPRAESYAMRRAMAGLPDDDDVLFARIDGMGALIHRTEIVGESATTENQYGPKPVNPSEIGQPCAACLGPLNSGDTVAVRPLGPGGDPQARVNARAGLPYAAATIELHWACATGDEQYQTAPGNSGNAPGHSGNGPEKGKA